MILEDIHRKSSWANLELPRIRLHGLWGIYLGDLFRRIATSLIGLYIPMYIYQVTGSLPKIAFFYFIYAFCGFIITYPGAKIIQKIGVDFSIVLGTIFRAIFIILLIFAARNENYFWLSAFFFGLCQPFDWLPYHFVISKISFLQKHFGSSTGISVIIAKIGAALGPIIGGLVITFFGYTCLYILAASFLVFAAVMPFLDDFEKKGMYVSASDILKCLRDHGIYKHLFAYGLENFDALASTIIWPIYLLSLVGTVRSSGTLQTISLLISMVITFVIGKYIDKSNLRMMKPGSVLHALGWWGRYIFRTRLGLVLFNTSFNIGATMVWMPHKALLYARSAKYKTMEFWMVHELICYAFMSLICLVFIIVLNKLDKVDILLPIFSIISVTSLLLPKLYRDYFKYLKK